MEDGDFGRCLGDAPRPAFQNRQAAALPESARLRLTKDLRVLH